MNELEYKGYKTKIVYSANDNCLYGKMEALEVKVSKLKQQLVEAEQELQYYRNLHISHLQSTCDHSDVVVHEHYNYHRDEYSYTTKCKSCQKILSTSPTLSTLELLEFIPD